MTECNEKSDGTGIVLSVSWRFANIPKHLMNYGIIMVVSLFVYIIIYFVIQYTDTEKFKRSFLHMHTVKPSLAKLVIGQEDNWLIRERGVAAYQYILFLRMLLKLSVIFLVISGVSLGINISQGTSRSSFKSTISSNIPLNSELHWFNVILSFFTPWLVVMMVMRLSKKIGNMKPLTKTFNRTLMIESSFYANGEAGSTKDVMEYFENKYPEFELVKILWIFNTKVMQALFSELELTEKVLEILEHCKEEDNQVTFFNKPRDLQFYEDQKIRLLGQIMKEKEEVSEKSPCVLFLSFQTHQQARHVYKQETRFCSLQPQLRFAPLPEEIIWSNIQSSASKWKGFIIATICTFVLAVISSTPVGFKSNLERMIGDGDSDRSTLFPPLLLIFFSALIPLAVKFSAVDFGSCSRTKSHPSYMRSLYVWLVSATIIFPIILSGVNSTLLESINSEEWESVLQKLECVLIADKGSFYINLLVAVAFVKCQLELHRAGDWCILACHMIWRCRSWGQREAAVRKHQSALTNRNGIRLNLADAYVWVVVYFSAWMFFSLICPIITPFFLLFLVCKYLVDIQNFRSFYTARYDQPELVTTAAKLTVFASLFPQLNITMFMIIRHLQKEDIIITVTTIILLVFNLVTLIIYQKLNWSTPIKLFQHSRAPSQHQSVGGEEEPGDDYQDDYEDPFMAKDVGCVDATAAKTKPPQKGLNWRQKVGKILPGEAIFSKTVHRAAQALPIV